MMVVSRMVRLTLAERVAYRETCERQAAEWSQPIDGSSVSRVAVMRAASGAWEAICRGRAARRSR